MIVVDAQNCDEVMLGRRLGGDLYVWTKEVNLLALRCINVHVNSRELIYVNAEKYTSIYTGDRGRAVGDWAVAVRGSLVDDRPLPRLIIPRFSTQGRVDAVSRRDVESAHM